MLTINGWTILAHPLFLDQLEKLIGAVEELKEKKPHEYQKKPSTKLLAALNKLLFQSIPADPTAAVYRQGGSLVKRTSIGLGQSSGMVAFACSSAIVQPRK